MRAAAKACREAATTVEGLDTAEAGGDEALDIAHHHHLGKIQVATDPDGMTLWPSGLTGWLWEQMGNKRNEVTATEARMLDELQMRQGLLGVKELNDIRQDALHRGRTSSTGRARPTGTRTRSGMLTGTPG